VLPKYGSSAKKQDVTTTQPSRLTLLGMSAGAKGDNNEGIDSFRAKETVPTLDTNQNIIDENLEPLSLRLHPSDYRAQPLPLSSMNTTFVLA
jgi:hypothetical protein